MVKVFWACEVCGHENEFSQAVHSMECNCCGSMASEKTFHRTQRKLKAAQDERVRQIKEEALRREKERKAEEARLEQLRKEAEAKRILEEQMAQIKQQVELLQKIVQYIVSSCKIATIFCFAWIFTAFYTNKLDFPSSMNQLKTNTISIQLSDNLMGTWENADDIFLDHRWNRYQKNIKRLDLWDRSQKTTDSSSNAKKNAAGRFSNAKTNLATQGQVIAKSMKRIPKRFQLIRNNVIENKAVFQEYIRSWGKELSRK